jgi:hypothetical protein
MMPRLRGLGTGLIVALLAATASAQSVEGSNGCMGTTVDPCVRTGDCAIQGATWPQTVTIDRSDLYDTMGWAGVCDQVHVALVQGNCSPGGAQTEVTADLGSNSSALISLISGPLSCAAPPPPAVPVVPPAGILGMAIVLGISGGVFAWLKRPAADA